MNILNLSDKAGGGNLVLCRLAQRSFDAGFCVNVVCVKAAKGQSINWATVSDNVQFGLRGLLTLYSNRSALNVVSCPIASIFLAVLPFYFTNVTRIVQADDLKVCREKFGALIGFLIYWWGWRLVRYKNVFYIETNPHPPLANRRKTTSFSVWDDDPMIKLDVSFKRNIDFFVLYRGEKIKGFELVRENKDYLARFNFKIGYFDKRPPNIDGENLVHLKSREQFLETLRCTKVFINASTHEGYSILNIEALNKGCVLLSRDLSNLDYLDVLPWPKFTDEMSFRELCTSLWVFSTDRDFMEEHFKDWSRYSALKRKNMNNTMQSLIKSIS